MKQYQKNIIYILKIYIIPILLWILLLSIPLLLDLNRQFIINNFLDKVIIKLNINTETVQSFVKGSSGILMSVISMTSSIALNVVKGYGDKVYGVYRNQVTFKNSFWVGTCRRASFLSPVFIIVLLAINCYLSCYILLISSYTMFFIQYRHYANSFVNDNEKYAIANYFWRVLSDDCSESAINQYKCTLDDVGNYINNGNEWSDAENIFDNLIFIIKKEVKKKSDIPYEKIYILVRMYFEKIICLQDDKIEEIFNYYLDYYYIYFIELNMEEEINNEEEEINDEEEIGDIIFLAFIDAVFPHIKSEKMDIVLTYLNNIGQRSFKICKQCGKSVPYFYFQKEAFWISIMLNEYYRVNSVDNLPIKQIIKIINRISKLSNNKSFGKKIKSVRHNKYWQKYWQIYPGMSQSEIDNYNSSVEEITNDFIYHVKPSLIHILVEN